MSWRDRQTYSQDWRGRVLKAEGNAWRVATRFGVSVSYVVKGFYRKVLDGYDLVQDLGPGSGLVDDGD